MCDGDNTLSTNIRHYRKQRGLTLEQLADKIDVTLNYLQTVESGKDIPSIELLIKISDVLEVQPKKLLISEELETAVHPEYSLLSHSDIHLLTTIISALNSEMSPEKPTIKSQIGRRIAENRIRLKMPRKELASRMGITPAFLGSIEAGAQGTTLKNLMAALTALDVPLEYILQDCSKSSNLQVLSDLLHWTKAKYSPKQYASITRLIQELLLFTESK